MLRQHELRAYLLALLCSEEVPQDAACNVGPIYEDCDGNAIDVEDSTTAQVDDGERSHPEKKATANIVIDVNDSRYTILPTKIDKVSITAEIVINSYGASGHERKNIADIITKRIFYRLFSYASFQDANDPQITYRSFMKWQRYNNFEVSITDETDFGGGYNIRTLSFTITTSSCISKGNCNDVPLCFDFGALTQLEKG